MKPFKTGLGRGLDALISLDEPAAPMSAQEAPSSISEVDLSLIHANPGQPRRDFEETSLNELADSIRSIGLIQPVTLRKEDDGTYLIIAGERRVRAAKIAGLETVPAYVRTASDDTVLEMALVENIQREDLNAIEVALAYQQLQVKRGLTHDDLAGRVGKSRTTVTNFLRLLKLPAEVQLALKERRLSMGHARALLGLEDAEQQVALYRMITAQDLTVRRVETLVRDFVEGRILDFRTEGQAEKNHSENHATETQADVFAAMTNKLSEMFSTHVKLSCNDKGQGKITIPFKDDKELQGILALLDKLN